MAGVLFALDGVFFGAGDLRFMRNVTVAGALLAFVPLTLLTWELDLGLGGIWAGLTAFVAVRLVAGLVRWQGRRWMVAGVGDRRRASVTETATIHTSITPEVALSTVVPGIGALTRASGISPSRQPGDEPRQRVAGADQVGGDGERHREAEPGKTADRAGCLGHRHRAVAGSGRCRSCSASAVTTAAPPIWSVAPAAAAAKPMVAIAVVPSPSDSRVRRPPKNTIRSAAPNPSRYPPAVNSFG